MMIFLCGRNIKVATGQKSQTINICTEENIHGQYEYKIRIRPPFVDQDKLAHITVNSVADIADYLVKNFDGVVEISPDSNKLSREATKAMGSSLPLTLDSRN